MAPLTEGATDAGRKRPRTQAVPAWKQRKLRKLAADRATAEARWAHHAAQELHKALKKAKQFEVRKLQRRLVQAKQEDAADPAAISKLSSQVEATKRLQLDELAKQMVAAAGWAAPAGEAAGSPAGGVVVAARVCGASCVRRAKEALAADREAKFSGLGPPALPDATQGATPEVHGSAAREEGDAGGSSDAGLSSDSGSGSDSSEEEGQGAPVDPPEAAAAADEPSLLEGTAGPEAAPAAAAAYTGQAAAAAAQQAARTAVHRAAVKRQTKLEKLLKRSKRPGQRVRRQLLEKMYGKAARHLQVQYKQQEHKQQRGSQAKKEQQQHKQAAAPQGRQPQQHRPHHPAAEPSPAAATIHPSWAAKKQQQQAAIRTRPQGVKVVFDEDGGAAQTLKSTSPAPAPAAASAEPSVRQRHAESQPRRPGGRFESSGPKPGAQQVPAEQLHPSWLAKRAAAAAVQQQLSGGGGGKKVVFTDDD